MVSKSVKMVSCISCCLDGALPSIGSVSCLSRVTSSGLGRSEDESTAVLLRFEAVTLETPRHKDVQQKAGDQYGTVEVFVFWDLVSSRFWEGVERGQKPVI